MTLPLALLFIALLLLYCGIKGRSFKAALLGHSVAGGAGSVLQGVSTSSSTPPQTPPSSAAPPGGVVVTPHGRAPLG